MAINIDADLVNADWVKGTLDDSLRLSEAEWGDRLRLMPEHQFVGYAMTPTGQTLLAEYDWFRGLLTAVGQERGLVPTLPPVTVVASMRLQDHLETAQRRRASLVAASAPVLAEWTSPGIAYLDTKTGDGRALSGEIDWRTPPLPLMAQLEDAHGSMPVMQSRMAGGINKLAIEDRAVPASGVLDDTESGRAALEALSSGRYGVSIDLAVLEAEYVLSGMEGDELIVLSSIAEDHGLAGPDDLVLPMSVDDELFVVTKGTIMGATIVPFAAFADAKIVLTAAGEGGYPEMIRLAPARHLVLERTAGRQILTNGGDQIASVGPDGTLHYHGRRHA